MKHYADIDGYRLEVGPNWHEYMPEELAQMCNGVGSANQPAILGALLGELPYLLPASRPHDVGYSVGGVERDRRADDRRFRRNAYRVAAAKLGPWWQRLFRSSRRAQWAFAVFEIETAYRMLRSFGRPAYNYHDGD